MGTPEEWGECGDYDREDSGAGVFTRGASCVLSSPCTGTYVVVLATCTGKPSWIGSKVESTYSRRGSCRRNRGLFIECTEAIYGFDYEV